MAALFPSSNSDGHVKYLVEFKAGKMTKKGTTVTPDDRKGLIYVYQSEDSLMHFCWKDRTTGQVDEDLILFPDDCEFIKINECKDGRCYALKFKASARINFYWMQELSDAKDDENVKKLNDLLSNPPTPETSRGGRIQVGGSGTGRASNETDLHSLLNNMSQSQLMHLFGNVGNMGGLSNILGTMNQSGGSSRSYTKGGTVTPASATPSTSTPTTTTTSASSTAATTSEDKSSTQNKIHLSNLQAILSNLTAATASVPSTSAGPATPGLTSPGATDGTLDLAGSITAESLKSIVQNPDFVTELCKHLPPGQNEPKDLDGNLKSPQFGQSESGLAASKAKEGSVGKKTNVATKTDVGAGTSAGTKTDVATGMGAGTKMDVGTGTVAGTKMDVGTGTDPGTKTDVGTGTDSGTKTEDNTKNAADKKKDK